MAGQVNEGRPWEQVTLRLGHVGGIKDDPPLEVSDQDSEDSLLHLSRKE